MERQKCCGNSIYIVTKDTQCISHFPFLDAVNGLIANVNATDTKKSKIGWEWCRTLSRVIHSDPS